MTVGPWKPITLQTYTARISDFHVKSIVSESLDTKFEVSLTASGALSSPLKANLTIKKPDGSVLSTHELSLDTEGKGNLTLEYKKGELELWWPIGYGAQPLYTFHVSLLSLSSPLIAVAEEELLDEKTQKVGVRRARVVQEALEGQEGLSFLFEVNGVRIWVGGSNW